MGYLLSINIVWKDDPLLLSTLSTMQTVQDEKWFIYCRRSILKMAPTIPCLPYVCISYQAKYAPNFQLLVSTCPSVRPSVRKKLAVMSLNTQQT